jgi:phage-related protein
VEEAVGELPLPDQAKIYAYIAKLQEFGYRLGVPFVKQMGDKLRELRIPISPGQYRVFFFFHSGEDFFLLHGILKKTQKTPPGDLELARKRMKAIQKSLGGRS